ncbi:CoA transferase [Microbacterium trichothecenolyticum]|uniref:CoA transferase n=1 Tax=Microbacterium ureisolvens TaxID=2781186 RepID=A0ABS7I486_9MICO|nr:MULTISPECIES: CoA transferase [Microbacterium]MBW9111889.1 CoA transferase [Microbacterium ureisolvens]MBW9122264.1 CoA transferase [Microbacterium trichothecenolyticum]
MSEISNVMMTAGLPGDPPVRFGVPIADLAAPLYAVIGTLAAVVQTDRTGVGQHVDVSMLGTLTSLVASEPFDALEEVGIPLRTGQTVPRLAPFGLFEAKDGWVAVCAPTDALANTVLAAIERLDLAEDPRFSRRDQRVANAEELHELIAEWTAGRTVEEALVSFKTHGVPAGPVRKTADAVRDPRVLARGEVVPLEHPVHGVQRDVYGAGVPILMSGSDTSLDRPAPYLGEHTATVLKNFLGYTPEEIAEVSGR